MVRQGVTVGVWLGLSAFVIMTYSLKTFANEALRNTFTAFIIMYIFAGFAILYWSVIRHTPVPWIADPSKTDLLLALLGTVVAFAVSLYFTNIPTQSVLFVPQLGVSIMPSIPRLDEAIYQIFIVAPAEELVVLAMIMAFTVAMPFKGSLWLPIGMSRALWSAAHAYLAYGGNPWIYVGALANGLIMSLLMVRSKSIIPAFMVHGFYNALIVVLRASVIG